MAAVLVIGLALLTGGAPVFAAGSAPQAINPPDEVLWSLDVDSAGLERYSYDVTQTLYTEAYLNIVDGAMKSPLGEYGPAPFPNSFLTSDITWTDVTAGTLGIVADLAYEDTQPFGAGLEYDALFELDYYSAPATGPYVARATWTGSANAPNADFTFVVTDQYNADSSQATASGIHYAIFDPATGQPYNPVGPLTVLGSDYVSLTHTGRSYATGFDGLFRAVYYEGAADGYTRYLNSDVLYSITIDGISYAYDAGYNTGWLYRVYKPSASPGRYVVDPLSQFIALDDYKLEDDDYVVLKYGNPYDDALFPAVYTP
ncbi:MAG: hypothetical protein LBS10_01955 [Gracilibacteraceae bacterium]|nr:hypothetical protein [Gracilibacteraceae bacterium]